jgi:hypothetical protein
MLSSILERRTELVQKYWLFVTSNKFEFRTIVGNGLLRFSSSNLTAFCHPIISPKLCFSSFLTSQPVNFHPNSIQKRKEKSQ